jgi:Mrp family chromosome partitioning ATPase
MNLETIDPSTAVDAHGNRRADAEVSACFQSLYRRLHRWSDAQQPLRVVGITGCGRGAGVSTVASGLAIAAAEDSESRVLLVDANPQMPSAHPDFTVDQAAGPHGTHSLDEGPQPSLRSNLWKLSLQTALAQSTTVERQTSVREILSGLLLDFSFIVLDLAPVERFGDIVDMQGAIDGTVLVVEAERTNRSLARAATEALSQSRLLGVILNKRQDPG